MRLAALETDMHDFQALDSGEELWQCSVQGVQTMLHGGPTLAGVGAGALPGPLTAS